MIKEPSYAYLHLNSWDKQLENIFPSDDKNHHLFYDFSCCFKRVQQVLVSEMCSLISVWTSKDIIRLCNNKHVLICESVVIAFLPRLVENCQLLFLGTRQLTFSHVLAQIWCLSPKLEELKIKSTSGKKYQDYLIINSHKRSPPACAVVPLSWKITSQPIL